MTSDQITIDQEDHTYVRSHTDGEDRPINHRLMSFVPSKNVKSKAVFFI